MGFWSFLRDMLVLDWIFGSNRNKTKPTNNVQDTSYNRDCNCNLDYEPHHSSKSSRNTWDDGYYANNDFYHNSHDDYAHDFDDFEDDF